MSEILCPKCNHPLTLNAERGMFRCETCGFKRPETLDEAAERIRAKGARPDVPITHRGALDSAGAFAVRDGAGIPVAEGQRRRARRLAGRHRHPAGFHRRASVDRQDQRRRAGQARPSGRGHRPRSGQPRRAADADGAERRDDARRSRTQPRTAHARDPAGSGRHRDGDDRPALPGLRRHADHRRGERAGGLPLLRAYRAAGRRVTPATARRFWARRCSSGGFSR